MSERSDVGSHATWNLYWCETPDHEEDWFVIGRTPEEASTFHEGAEGYAPGEATAELVCVIPIHLQNKIQKQVDAEDEHDEKRWPSDAILLACGAEFLPNVAQDGLNELRRQMDSGTRVVRLNGRIFVEGDAVGSTSSRTGRAH